MKQTITYNNQLYITLDYITLGTTKYLFVINENTLDFKCLIETQSAFFYEYSNNSSFLPCDINKTLIISHFIDQIKPQLNKNINYDKLVISIKKLFFYIQQSDLKYYVNDNIPYNLNEQSLANLDLFLSKTIDIVDQNSDTQIKTTEVDHSNEQITPLSTNISSPSDVNDSFASSNNTLSTSDIKPLPITNNRPLAFKNKLYKVFYRLDIFDTIYAFSIDKNQSEVKVFLETIKNNTTSYKIPSMNINDNMLPLNIINKNILVNYFSNKVNQEVLKYNNIEIPYVINSIDKFAFYLKESELKENISSSNPLALNSQSIINIFLFFDQTIKVADQVIKTPTTVDMHEDKIVSPPISMPNENEIISGNPIANENLDSEQIQKKRKIFNIYTFIIVASILIALVGGYFLFKWFFDGAKTEKLNDEIKDNVTIEESTGGEAVNPPAEETTTLTDYWKYMQMSLINVDFNALKSINQDTVGWIQVNGTNINYPIVQSGDNNYYLQHAFDGSYNNAGWIFADYRNNLGNLSKNNIIYGHGRLDSTMFGSLKNILTSDWYNNADNHVVKLSTPSQNTLWQVFSVYAIEAESYYITTEFPTNNQYDLFLKTISGRSIFSFNADVNTSDVILTLSTCQDNYNHRVVMHAKLIKSENR